MQTKNPDETREKFIPCGTCPSDTVGAGVKYVGIVLSTGDADRTSTDAGVPRAAGVITVLLGPVDPPGGWRSGRYPIS